MTEKRTYDQQTLEHLQAAELEILDAIADVCAEHGISWWLDSGSALGVLRHGGFVPWDDDADIGMMWGDYLRFCQIAPKALPPRFRLDDPRANRSMHSQFAKVCLRGSAFETAETRDVGYDQGIFVDVFPYGLAPEDPEAFKKQAAAIFRANRMKYLYCTRHITVPHKGARGRAELAACAVAHVAVKAAYSPARLDRLFEKAVFANNPGHRSPHTGDMTMNYAYPRKARPFETFVPTKPMAFEGRSYPVPGDIEHYLSTAYRNWKQMPPPEKRRSHMPLRLKFPK